ncbi:MAG: histone deacetylase [Chloroflexi bacterium]|nr:histone deacetylase [Chloroflexota bacterium]
MARVGYVYDPLYLEHGVSGHPESPARLQAIISHLQESGLLDKLVEVPARDASSADLELVHSWELVAHVRAKAEEDGGWLDADTYVGPNSYAVALRAVGGCLAASEAVLNGEIDCAFCLVRPPGHHATPTKAMGFCLFNNVAIVAKDALERRGVERIAVVDFDVHHGNGTQDAFYADPRVLYFSTHQYPFYPGSGYWAETGEGDARGTTVNVPLPRGSGDEEYIRAYREVCAPVVRRFRPRLLLVSAGFDAHFADPLAQMLLSVRGYYEIASLLRSLAEELCEGRVLFALEGGYDHTALPWGVHACLDALLGNEFTPEPLGPAPSVPGPSIDVVLTAVKRANGLDEA